VEVGVVKPFVVVEGGDKVEVRLMMEFGIYITD